MLTQLCPCPCILLGTPSPLVKAVLDQGISLGKEQALYLHPCAIRPGHPSPQEELEVEEGRRAALHAASRFGLNVAAARCSPGNPCAHLSWGWGTVRLAGCAEGEVRGVAVGSVWSGLGQLTGPMVVSDKIGGGCCPPSPPRPSSPSPSITDPLKAGLMRGHNIMS